MSDGDVRIVHAIPGRIRVRVPRLKDNPGYADTVSGRLRALPGVVRVESNVRTGSVLVTYGTGAGIAELVPGLSEALQASVLPDLRAVDLEARLLGGSNGSNGSDPATPLASRITSFLGTLDQGVGGATGGYLDLRVLLPLSLFVLGVSRLLSSNNLPFPTWFDLIWFSFGTFVALNSQAIGVAGQLP